MLLSHVPHIQVKIHSECFREQGAGEDIWAKKGGSNLGEGGGRKLQSDKPHNFYSSPNTVIFG